jgi:hypothetical protein
MNKLIILLLAASACCFAACKKITDGFLSDTLRYKSPDLYCQRGLPLVQSDPINLDGSTPPVAFKMLNLRDSFGKSLPAQWNTQYDITVFKPGMTFDVNTDTTVALLNQKREPKHVTPMEFNTVSGQLTFNKGSVNLPLGIYVFDIQATNVHGTKFYPSLGRINVVDPTNDDMFQVEDNTNNAFDASGAVTPMKGLKVIFTKVSAEGDRIILKLTDKNGSPFDPKAGEIIKRGDRPTFENYTRFHPIQYTDTAMICDFEVPPFPLAQYIDVNGTNWNHLIYYRIPSQFVVVDGLAAHQYTSNVRIAFDIKLDGTYIVEYRMTDATRTP